MVIQAYPDFRPLQLDDKPLFDKAFELLQPRLSEYTFSNLYAWRNAYTFSVASCEGCIVVRTGRYAQPHYLLPLGIDERAQVKQVIERIVREEGNPFIRIPEETASLFDGSLSLEKRQERDNADYLYKAEDLIYLRGRGYDGKRNHGDAYFESRCRFPGIVPDHNERVLKQRSAGRYVRESGTGSGCGGAA